MKSRTQGNFLQFAVAAMVAIIGLICSGMIDARISPSQAHAESQKFTYDALGRLVRVDFADINKSSVTYEYDAAGNRTQTTQNSGIPKTGFNATIQITGVSPVNLRTLADAAGYNGAQTADVIFQLPSGTTISGASGAPVGGIAIDTGTWPTSSYATTLTLQVSGKAYGGGGSGGGGNGGLGSVGGDAVHCRLPMTIVVNAGGEIRAGGGGGGGGGRGKQKQGTEIFLYGGGGGGGGAPNGPGGPGGGGDGGNGNPGGPGTTSGGGLGGSSPGGGPGGNGGTFGATGSAGSSANQAGGAGAAAGYAIRKNGFTVNVTNNGVITGTQG